MSERTPPAGDEPDEAADGRQAIVIPDGGLGAAMPEWLQQPPAWKRAREVGAVPDLPPPDTSEIDPRAMLDIEDLPRWLQDIAGREHEASAGAKAPIAPVRSPGQASALRPRDEATPSETPTVTYGWPGDETLPQPLRMTPDRPWWTSDLATGMLLAAVVLTMIYVILVASDVL